jgi:hypothetical protein
VTSVTRQHGTLTKIEVQRDNRVTAITCQPFPLIAYDAPCGDHRNIVDSGSVSSHLRRALPWTIIGSLIALTIISIVWSASQAPRFFDTPGSGSSSATKVLRKAAWDTEHSKSFTAVTYEGGQEPTQVVYQAPDISSSKVLLDLSIVSVGDYTYISSGCKKMTWDKFPSPTGYGPGGVMYDLDILLSSQKVVRRGDQYLAEWVPSFPGVRADVVATVKQKKVVAERETFIYGNGTGWFLRPFTQHNYGYTVRYTRINSSPPIKVPPRGTLEEGNQEGVSRGCASYGAVSFGFPTNS